MVSAHVKTRAQDRGTSTCSNASCPAEAGHPVIPQRFRFSGRNANTDRPHPRAVTTTRQGHARMKITDVPLTLFAWDNIPATRYAAHTGRFGGGSQLGLVTVRT